MTKPLHADGPWHDDGVNDPDVSDFLNDARTWMPDMVDGAGGGSWSPTAPITVGGSGLSIGSASPAIANTGMLSTLSFAVGAFLAMVQGADIPDIDNQTIDPADGLVQRFALPALIRDHDMVAAGNTGRVVILLQGKTAGAAINVHRSGFAGDYIVQFNANWGAAVLYDDGTNWRLLYMAGLTVAGAEA